MKLRSISSNVSAFTLTEVLIATVLALVITAAAGTALIIHTRTITRRAVILRFQNDWARLSNLLETEISEGASLQTTLGADCQNELTDLQSLLFTVELPVIVDNDGDGSDDRDILQRQISYYQDTGGNLRRCGPPVDSEGRLIANPANPDQVVDAELLENAILNIDQDPGAGVQTLADGDLFLRYNLTITQQAQNLNPEITATYPQPALFVTARIRAGYVNE